MNGARSNSDRGLLGAHLWSDRKDARGIALRWSAGGLTRRMRFIVHRGDITLTVEAEFRTAQHQQIRLHHPSWYQGRHPIARLCVVNDHGGEPHWHLFEGPGEPRDTRMVELAQGADLADPGYLLVEEFLSRLKVDRYSYEGSLDA